MQEKFSQAVLYNMLYVPRKEIDVPYYRRLLTVERKYEGDPVAIYDDSQKAWFGVPLYHFRNHEMLAEELIDKRTTGKSISFNFTSGLREEQVPVVSKFEGYLSKGIEGFIFEAPPAFGKTVVLIKMLSMIGQTALIVVPRSNLVKQWVERFLEHSDLKKSDIGIALEDKCSFKGKKVVVGLVHSLALDKFGKEFRNAFGCAVFDEVDRSVPPTTFAPVIGMFPVKYRIGASATLKRQDGLDVVFEKHIGQAFLRGVDNGRMKTKVLMHSFPINSGYVHPASAKLNRRGMILSRLSQNPLRNKLILDYIELLMDSDRPTLILSDRTEQLMTLREDLLERRTDLSQRETGLYVRSIPILGQQTSSGKRKTRTITHEERKRIESECRVIFATYKMFDLGTDIERLAGLVYATPQSETEQSRGRIERKMKGKKDPVVVDLIDTAYSDCVNWGRKRERQYRSKGLSIVKRYGGSV